MYKKTHMTDLEDYKRTDLRMYQRLVRKLIYILYGRRLYIAFVIEQLDRHNADLKETLF